MANLDGNTIAGSKTGLMRRPIMQVDGSESDVSRTGMFKRRKKGFERGDGEERREPPAPPNLPEINRDDGGTTGITTVDTEGQDPAKRENHPRR
ncbi:MAG: hypothetical protein AAF787_03765 [Chloroflexota bacterium]